LKKRVPVCAIKNENIPPANMGSVKDNEKGKEKEIGGNRG